jgi:thiamine-phosphate pyrophosphorylase
MNAGIYLIWDLPAADGVAPEPFFAALGDDLPCAVQLRAKVQSEPPAVLDALSRACAQRRIPFFINDQRAWLRTGHSGIHLGQDDGSSDGLDGFWVSRSTHDLTQVQRAALEPEVRALGFGPLRHTTSKADALPPLGLEALGAAVVAAGSKPVIAIGGISGEDLVAIRRSGAHAAAVIGAVWHANDPPSALRMLVRAWNAS